MEYKKSESKTEVKENKINILIPSADAEQE